MKRKLQLSRILALFLTLCALVGLLPLGGVPEVRGAEAANEATIASLQEELRGQYADLRIPATMAKLVKDNNLLANLDGTYFMVNYDFGASRKHRIIDTGNPEGNHFDRLNGNCYNKPPTDGAYNNYLSTVHVNIANYSATSENFSFDRIVDFTPANLLDYAVEIYRYKPHGPLKYDTDMYYNILEEETGIYHSGTGWVQYNNWEYKRDNGATTGTQSFGAALGITSIQSSSDPAYIIKSLHPSRAAAPYLGTTDTYGAAGYNDAAIPIFFKKNADNRTIKAYKIDHTGGHFYTYWYGVDAYYTQNPASPVSVHTISQIVREDKNQNTKEFPGHNANKFNMDWELIQVSPLSLELYKAIYKAKSYVEDTDALTKYSAEVYLDLLQLVQQAMPEYKNNYTTFNTDANNATRIRLDKLAKDLHSAMRNLDIEADSDSYTETVSAEELRVVADYGKPIEFTVTDIMNCLTYHSQDAKISFVGICKGASHGSASFLQPEGIRLTDKNGGDSMSTGQGVYERTGDIIRFTPTKMLDSIDRVCAVLCIDDAYLSRDRYFTVAIEVIPATMVYYEAEGIEELTGSNLTLKEKSAIGDSTTTGKQFTSVTDEGNKQSPAPTYDPTKDQSVLYFGFDNTAADQERYKKNNNPIYGGVNFDLASNWWTPSYGAVQKVEDGALIFTSRNTKDTWGYVATGAKGNPADSANAAQFPLKYVPHPEDWCEIRMKVEGASAYSGSELNFYLELFPDAGNADLRARAATTFPVSDVGKGYFVLKFPMNKGDGVPSIFHYEDLHLIRRINLLFGNMKADCAITVSVDYLFIGAEEKCPSNQGKDYLYFGFDNTAADQYRYDNPIYGGIYNFDTSSFYMDNGINVTGDWIFTQTRVASLTAIPVSQNNPIGRMEVLVGTAGGENTNSPYLQTGLTNSTQALLNYPATRGEVARVKLKFSNLTLDLTEDRPDYALEQEYPEDRAVARLGFLLNSHTKYEDSHCFIDWPLTEEQLNGCDYMTLEADITELLERCGAERITAVRLTIVNAAGMVGETGTFWVDEIYVGPKTTQDPGSYASASDSPIAELPPEDPYTANYDDRALYFGFDGTTQDVSRYTNNQNYGGTNFDDGSNWRYNGSRSSAPSMGGGFMTYTVTATGEPWFETMKGGNSGTMVMNYNPAEAEVVQVRVKFNGLNASNVSMGFLFGDGSKNTNGTAEAYIGASYYTIPSGEISSSNKWFTYTLPLGTAFTSKPKVTAIRLNFAGAKSANGTGTIVFDYIYVGPRATAPSFVNADYVHFGFENDALAQYKYNSSIYGGTNFDLTTNWRYGRSSAATMSGGTMSYTISSQGDPWFETQKNRGTTSMTMDYNGAKAEVLQLRVKFHDVELISNTTSPQLQCQFGLQGGFEPMYHVNTIDIPAADVTTNDKWFTYVISLDSGIRGVTNAAGLRVRFLNIRSTDNTGTITFDYIYLGPSLTKNLPDYCPEENTYGYDFSYTADRLYSDNGSLYMEGKGVPLMNSDGSCNYEGTSKYTEINFSFTGTGFDLIGRTGPDQGTIRLSVYNSSEKSNASCEKSITVNCKGEQELYQIPVVSIQGLNHGTHHVSLWVQDKVESTGLSFLDRGNQFYFDALRIYDPIDVSGDSLTEEQTIALEAYKGHGEAYSHIKEIRNILLSAQDFEALLNVGTGAVFVDTEITPSENVPATDANGEPTDETVVIRPEDVVIENHLTAKAATYNKAGPKNEVYLAPGQAVAFMVEIPMGNTPKSVDVGVKTIRSSEEAAFVGGIVTRGTNAQGLLSLSSRCEVNIRSATALYYSLNISEESFFVEGNRRYCYIVLYNKPGNNTGILSVTDIKAAYGQKPTGLPQDQPTDPEIQSLPEKKQTQEYFNLVVDSRAVEAAALVMRAALGTPLSADGVQIMHSLSLASDIAVNYVVSKDALADYDSFYLECKIPTWEAPLRIDPVEKDGYYYFTLNGLTAVQMTEEISATLRMEKDGVAYCSETDVYSIAQYAYSQLGKDTVSAELKALCAELLRYGAAAQIYKGHATDRLPDSAMTEEQRALLTDLEKVSFDNINTVSQELPDSPISWAGKSLVLDSRVTLRYVLDLSRYEGDLGELRLVVLHENTANTEESTWWQSVLTDPTVYDEEKGYYSFDFSSLLAAELRKPVRATLYVGDTPLTSTLTYSVSTYGTNKTGSLGHLCRCLMAYSDSARAFFAN